MSIKIVVGLLLSIVILAGGANAGTLSYVDVSCLNSGADICSSTMYVYYTNGTLAGSLTGVNDTISYDETQAINLYLKPASTSLLNNPAFYFDWMMNSWSLLFVLLLIMAVVIGFMYIIKRMFMSNKNDVGNPRPVKRKW